MRDARQIVNGGLQALLKAGADKAQCSLSLSEKHEMNVDSGQMSLLRTTFDTRLDMTAIKDGRKGSTTLNKSDQDAIGMAATDVMAIADGSPPDDANDISEKQEPAEFVSGDESPDLGAMHSRLKALLETVKARYPKVVIVQAIFSFMKARNYFLNSNGVSFQSTQGVYEFVMMFAARDGAKVSSVNGTGVFLKDLGKELIESGSLDTLLRQAEDQIDPRSMQGKFVGDVIVTPDCMDDFIGFLAGAISDGPMIAGTSVYKNSLGQQIASPVLSLHSRPISDEIANGYFFTSDGYAADNSTIVENGVLKTHLLSLYGSKKTGLKRAVNGGGAYVIDSGHDSLEEMIKSVKRGILLARFSGGRPSDNGDFSGVAKNSYLIEDGEIKYPITETMVSGSMVEAFRSIKSISRERVDFGSQIYPWIQISGVTISGK